MFERFTAGARETVVGAQEQARRLQSSTIGSEHLLLALCDRGPGDAARDTLDEFGLSRGVVEAGLAARSPTEPLDATALESIGVDLDEIRRKVEAQFGPGALDAQPSQRRSWFRPRGGGAGHLPFTDDAKATLELALREAIDLHDRTITSGHLLLGLVRLGSGGGCRVIEAQGVDVGLLRTRLGQRMRSTA